MSSSDLTIPADRSRERHATPLDQGDLIDRYVLLSKLGAGGMGVVYAAYDPELDRKVAIKLLRPVDDLGHSEGAGRLLREAQALAKLTHPNVIGVYDVGIIGDRVYVAMEYVSGRTLGAWARGRPSWREIIRSYLAAGRGLAAAHEKGLVHRDFKPENAMIDDAGRVLVLDFGLARAAFSASPEEAAASQSARLTDSLTEVGAVVGTPAYMAPEQLEAADIDAKADQFSYCVALWEALYSERPYRGDSFAELAANVLAGKRTEPSNPRAAPRRIRAALVRGLHPDPSARWASMDALLAELGRDPRPRNASLGLLGAALAIVAGFVGAEHVRETRVRESCAELGDTIQSVWNSDTREELAAAFRATGASYWEPTFESTASWLDRRATAWAQHRTGSCLEARLRDNGGGTEHTQTEACFAQKRAELSARIEALKAAEAGSLQHATLSAATVSDPAVCQDADLVKRQPPLDPDVDPKVIADARRDLERAAALEQLAEYEHALSVAQDAEAAAEEVGWTPLRAEAALRRAGILERLQRHSEAEAGFESAYLLAAEVGHDQIAAQAAIALIFDVGYLQSRFDDGLRWAKIGAMELKRGGIDDPLKRALLHSNRGAVAVGRGDVASAIADFETALALEEEALGEDHPHVARVLGNLGIAYRRAARFDDAESALKRSLSLLQAALGENHPDVANVLESLGALAFDLDRLQDARSFHERSLAIRKATLGDEHIDVAYSLTNLGNVANAEGRWNDAVGFHRGALKIKESTLGPDNVEVAVALDNLGTALSGLGRLDEARASHERAARLEEAAGGPESLGLAASLGSLGHVLEDQGELAAALEVQQRALGIEEAALGKDHPTVAGTLTDLGQLRLAQGNLPEARALFERALRIKQDAYGTDNPKLATTLIGLGSVLRGLGSMADAIRHHERAVDLLEGSTRDPAGLAEARFTLARSLASEEPARADELARSALARFRDLGDERAKEVERWMEGRE